MRNRERAKELAQHYFQLFADELGLPWDSDNHAEIEEMIDSIIDAAIEVMMARQHKAQEEEAAGSFADYKQRYQ